MGYAVIVCDRMWSKLACGLGNKSCLGSRQEMGEIRHKLFYVSKCTLHH